MLAINSASENKDGAWAFMEYLLSETYQSSIQTDSINDHFPVRQDSFDAYITRQFNEWERRSENSPGRDMNSVTKEVWQEYPALPDFVLQDPDIPPESKTHCPYFPVP